MRYFMLFLAITVFASCNTSSETSSQKLAQKPMPAPEMAADVKHQLDSMVKATATEYKCSVTAKVSSGNGAAHYSGFDGRTNKEITDFSKTIDIGSCSKMFTATAVMQLIEKGKLSLESKLTDVLPNKNLYKDLLVIDGKDYIDEVTVTNLLNHSSGLPDYFIEGDDAGEFKKHGDSTLRFSPEQLIMLAKETNKPYFKPGESFKYSNTNYILLGLIIEKLSGKKYYQYIQANILDPLALKNTFFASVNTPLRRSTGHFMGDVSVMPATMAWSAGEIISDLDDMITFITAWNEGKLFAKKETIEVLKTKHYREMMGKVIQYGLGVINLTENSFGHAGQTFGFQAYMAAMPNGYRFAFGIDEASVSAWNIAIALTNDLAKAN